ncbi:SRPBCC domain-containing protein [Pontivivens insulae]|uniref:Activator of Hsp90 ATPase homologue 1/2-like C-terminal domain-containing protein n=1 Tax=Pontivivens insulae TaxID=1639689 RepID=A0A2R8A6K3_9RHOB|nr:SRPBCC domain-containing protein [Pontivivens insulae]RED17937.1 activator of Hsp90 ATPase-like protein [Pontivivens insulae]SPF27826.1 hypothetical protein POI8812_00121 [Pontivivens insulae]
MLPPLEREVTVPCGAEMAFTVFLEEMETWWPLGMMTLSAMNGAPAKGIRTEAREGAEIIEIGADGTETSWGHVVTCNPPTELVLRFHIPAPGRPAQGRSLLELNFEELGPDSTRVRLKQSDWEALGTDADNVQGGYGKAWGMLLDNAYSQACAAKAGG